MFKRILVRAGYNPTKEYQPWQFFSKSLVGSNLGNLIYAYGAMNVLMTEDTSIEQLYDKAFYSEKEIDFINSNYDVFVMPMADAFRSPYIAQLKSYTNFIQKLKIPVIVLGIGYRTSYEPQFDYDPELNNVVKNFVGSVLNHSTKLGLRGDITGTYLKKLGFKEDRDFVTIGCPSLYTYGDNTHIREFSLADLEKGKLIFSSNTYAQSHFEDYIPYINKFIRMFVETMRNHYLIQQRSQEFYSIYLGGHFFRKFVNDSFFADVNIDEMLKEDRVKCFINVPSWIKFCSDADLLVGNRFHGAVAAILAGTPHIFIPIDGRTRELSEFHHFTTISPDELKKEKSIYEYLTELDFYSFDRYHEQNLRNYLDFLSQNGLSHIFQDKMGVKYGESPMEKQIDYSFAPISCMDSLSFLRKLGRLTAYVPFVLYKSKFLSRFK